MKKTRFWKWIAAGATGLAFLFAFIFSMGGGIESLKEAGAPSDNITASAATVNYEDYEGDKFSRFKDNAKYSYTEPTKARSYHNAFMLGNTPTDVDVKDVTADVEVGRGTESNPFVITTVAEWNEFAKMATSYSATQNKYFALGCDIDAAAGGEQILPIPAFGGTFCGNGYMISNITMSTPAATNSGRGLFNSTSGATISDLRIDMNMTATSAASNNGGLVGYVEGATNILNCQADVVWNQTGGTSGNFGGLVGGTAAVQVLLYRCSVNYKFTMQTGTNNGAYYGGMIGRTTGAVQLSIFDSTVKTVSDLGTSSVDKFSGGVVGVLYTSNNSNINIENVVSDIDAKSGKVTWDAAVLHVQASTQYPKTLVLKNVYASGTDTVGSTTTSRQLVNAGTTNSHQTYVRNASSFTNVHITRYYTRKVGAYFADAADYDTSSLKYYAEAVSGTDQEDAETKLWTAAGNDSKLPAEIWTDKSKIGTEFGTKSPIVNDMLVRVTYHNYVVNPASGADISTQFTVTDDSVLTVSRGDPLYVPTAAETPENRKFLGWTSDPTNSTDTFSEMVSGLRGEAKLYAVWEVINAGASIAASGTGLTDEPDTGKTLVYNGNGGSSGITLTAELATITGMSDPAVSDYQWAEGGKDLTEGATSKIYKVENVTQSGDYTVKMKFHSASEPLFIGEVTTPSVTATITPAEVTLKECRFIDVHPYSGAPYQTAVPTATVMFGRTEVTGTTEWLDKPGNFNRIEENVKDGKETKKICFKPDASYNGNYGTDVVFDITFEIEYLKFTFEIPSYGTKDILEVNLEYGQPYTYNNVADLFEEAFKPYMGDKTLEGLTPVFVLKDTRRLKINEYRKAGTTAYSNVTTDLSLEVDFEAQSYKVTYNPLNGDETFEETVGHGIRLARPIDPKNGNLLFLGWYYETQEENESGQTVPVEKAWNYDVDRVTHELSLYAKWLEADTLDNLEVDVTPGTVFHANEPIDPSALTVTATFTGKGDNQDLTLKSILSHEQYTLEYVGYNDGRLHVNEDGTDTIVKVKYVFERPGKPSQEKEVDLTIKPKKIPIDTSKLKQYFKDTTVEIDKDGNAQSLSITAGRVSYLFSPQLTDADVEYVYSVRGKPVPQNEVVGEGEYLVTANFKPTDPDYDAPPITATLRIVKERLTLNVTWDAEEFIYNGKIQVPTPTFTAMLDGNETTIDNVNYRLEGDNYSVTLVLDEAETGYKLGGIGAIIKTFSIKKAKVKVPTQIEPFEYCGKEYDLNNLTPDDYTRYFDGFDPNIMTVGDGAKSIIAGFYTAFITLAEPTCAEWDGVTTARVSMNWEIKKAQLSVFWGNERKFGLDSEVPTVQNFIGLKGDDATAVNYATDVTYRGDSDMSVTGSHTLTVAFKSSAAWAKNYELDDSKSFSFVVLPGDADVILVYVEWGDTTRFVFKEGEMQGPTFTLRDSETNDDLTAELIDYVRFEGPEQSLWAGSYDLKLSLDSDEYFLYGKTSCRYTILKDGDKGANPNADTPTNPDDPNNTGNTGDPGREDTTDLPLWQLIVTGVSAVLFVVCAAKAFSNYSKAKEAKKEAKELAATSYAVGYAFAPLPLLAIEFLGLGETPWTVIACVTLGLFLLAFAAMLLLGKKRKAAELLLKREQARIAEEKEYAREEEQLRREEELRAEQRRRDEEFKMMFAAMQQGNQSQYGDMQNLLATVTALLPGMQQMQALPPAPSDSNAYNAQQPNYGAQPNYGTPQPDYNAPNYGTPQNPETDALRAQMAAQEERMARQEALINELMQERQANRGYSAPAAAYPQQDAVAAENARQEELLTQFDANEGTPVSLEESYGNLSDEAKRFYYEIGCFIMERPNVMQNDGKYAVLFKYRGKTLFKLSIRNDAPVLTYIQNGAPVEQSVVDEGSLGYAKQIMAACIAATDKELDG